MGAKLKEKNENPTPKVENDLDEKLELAKGSRYVEVDSEGNRVLRKHKVTTPWKPSNKLPSNTDNDGFHRRWIHIKRLDSAIFEGYDPISYADPDCPANARAAATIIEGSNMQGYVKRGNLIFCRIPIELAEQKRAHHLKESRGLAREGLIENLEGQVTELGDPRASTYGAIRQKHNSKMSFIEEDDED